MKKEKKVWLTGDGQRVPDEAVSPFDKKKEPKMVAMLKRVKAAQKAVEDADIYLRETGVALYGEMCVNRGVELGFMDGFTLTNYAKNVKLEARKNSVITLNGEVDIAKKLFNRYLDTVLSADHAEIRALVQTAFSARNGELDPKRLMQIKNLRIEHPEWKAAVESLNAGMDVTTTKRYFVLSERDAEGEWKTLSF